MIPQENAPLSRPRAKLWRISGYRWALLGGFGALLLLMAFISVDALSTLGTFEANNAQIQQAFLDRKHALDLVRGSLYESATLVSSELAGSGAQETGPDKLQSLQNETTAELNATIGSLPAQERAPYQRLAAEMDDYWSMIRPLFGGHTAYRGDSTRRSGVIQRYVEILKITVDLSALNSDGLRKAGQENAELSAQFRRRLLTVIALSLGFGLVLASATVRYSGRLESRIEERYRESLRTQAHLRELSKRLVDTEERERRAISRELHDEVGQSLSALLLDLQRLIEISGNNDALRRSLSDIKVSAETCLEEVRNMALLLRPSMLDDLGLTAALDWQAREVSKRTGMMVEMVEENVSDELPEEHKTCVYRVVQEALNNCSRHANARNVHVLVRQEPDRLRVAIQDDGKGFDPSRSQGLGLLGMKERVTHLGGRLSVNSQVGSGTRLEVELPLPVSQGVGEKAIS